MAKLIAITGTHGTGKTTLSFLLAAEYKKLGANVKIIQEVARSCPFPLNDKMIKETALWIYHEHSKKELEACRDHDVIICDRTSFDSFVYAEAMKIQGLGQEKYAAMHHIYEYSELYLVRPDYAWDIKNDGIRSMDLDFQSEVDHLFSIYIDKFLPEQIKSSQIFDKDKAWNISY